MDYDGIIEITERSSGGLDRATAELAIQATLRTLAERLPRGEARHILDELPTELKPWIYTETDAEALDIDEFLNRVAKRLGTDTATTLRLARAVFFALGEALTSDEVGHLTASLPEGFDPLVAQAQERCFDLMPACAFWHRVATRLCVTEESAWRITEAVLRTLAERIAKDEVDDLISQLDPPLHPPLRSGAAEPDARRMPLAKFLRLVAAREGSEVSEADLATVTTDHVRAVLATLAEAVSQREWFDVTAELPRDYDVLIPADVG